MAHISQSGLAGRKSAVRTRNMHWGGNMPRSNVARRRTREDAKLYRGTGVMFDTEGYSVFLSNLERGDLGCRMKVRIGGNILVRDPKLARELDSKTGVGMSLHFQLTGESEGVLARPVNPKLMPAAIITTRKGVRMYGASRFRLIARPNVGPALFVVWPDAGCSFEIEGVEYRMVSRRHSKKRPHNNAVFIERVTPVTTSDDELISAA